jgi:glycosyltransferase involved in cell wall biosynthesis
VEYLQSGPVQGESLPWPKISIVTPSFNQAKWLEATLQSVLSQNYPNLEYGVVDGNSTDGSIEILERYRDRLSFCIIEPDEGMYHAIAKGFDRTTGSIMGWLNSDDMLHPGALHNLASIFSQLPAVQWLTGTRAVFSEAGCTVAIEPAPAWSPERFFSDHRWIQQESTYWHRNLWEYIGSRLDLSLRLAGDYELWHRCYTSGAQLYVTDSLIGGFRARSSAQASLDSLDAYQLEVAAVHIAQPPPQEIRDRMDSIESRERIISALPGLPKSRLRQSLIQPLYTTPPRIYFDRLAQRFRFHSQA